MKNGKTSRSKHLDFIFLDLICVEVSFLIAYLLRLGRENGELTQDYIIINALIVVAHLAIVFSMESYSGILRRGYLKELKEVILYNIEVLAVVLMVLFFSKQSEVYSRIVLGIFSIINVIIVYVVRCLRKKYLCKTKENTNKLSYMLLVTDYANASKYISGLKSYNYSPFSVRGVVIEDRDMVGQKIDGVEVVANSETMYDYVKNNVIDEVFFAVSTSDVSEKVNRILNMGVTADVNINEFLPNIPNPAIQNMNDYTVISASIGCVSLKQKVIKRLFDIFVALFGIIITGLLTIVLGIIIKIQSPGPIFFKQKRVGKNGRIFKMYKFRSMYMDAEERKKELMEHNKMSGLMFKMDDDPRITPIGKFIRKTSLDEFPQFINILKGDMSLVGTRPPTLDEYVQYEPHHKSRLAIKPGLTGMWQVSGRSEITDFEEIVRLDNEYIRNFSLSNDLKIMFKTVLVVFKRKGSV